MHGTFGGLTLRAVPPEVRRTSAVTRVALLGDLCRFSLDGTALNTPTYRNVAWLRELLASVPALKAPDLEVELLQPAPQPDVDLAWLGGRHVAEAYRADAMLAWAARFDTPQLDVFPEVLRRAVEADLVVGHELPPSVKRHLHANGRRYVSFYIHPLRMLRDLCLGATTNDPAIADALVRVAVPEAEVRAQVHRFRALCHFHRLRAFAFPEGLPVLVGQTERDSVLIEQGRFIDWPDREDALAAALQGFDAVVFIEHPFRADSRRVTEYLRCRHGKTVIATDANGYGLLLSANDVPKVLTLSSSLGVEACAFGWPTEFLLQDPRRQLQVDGIDQPFDLPLGHGVLGDAFWHRLVGTAATPRGRSKALQRGHEPFVRGEHYLRDSLESWSYHLLRSHLAGARSRKTLMPHGALDPGRRAALVDALLPLPMGEPPLRKSPASPEVVFEELMPPIVPGRVHVWRGSEPGFRQFLGSGFHPTESWGAWSSQHRCELLMAVAPPAGRGLLSVTIDIGGFEGTLTRSPVLALSAGGRVLALVMLREHDTPTARVTVALPVEAGLARLVIEMSHVASPKETGLGNDDRRYGFGLTAVELELRSADDAELLALLEATQVWGVPQADGSGSAAQRRFPVMS